jgi:hypothetical protein
MSLETKVLLRTLLFQMGKVETAEQARRVIRVMCDSDDVAAVEKMLREEREETEAEREKQKTQPTR